MVILYMLKFYLILLYTVCDSNADRVPKVCVDDCIIYTECKNAAVVVQKCLINGGAKLNAYNDYCENSKAKFVASYCGKSPVNNKTPMVCCSDFVDDVKINIGKIFLDETDQPHTENHRNFQLLSDDCGLIYGARIITGGSKASLYEYPWMALIAHRIARGIAFFCSGTIINSRYILTAAHCVQNQNIPWVRIGEYKQRNECDCQYLEGDYVCESHLQDIDVEDTIVHENYRSYPEEVNDIALLRLKKPIDFSYKNAAPICLPLYNASRSLQLGGLTATVAGWGLTEFGYNSDILLKVNIPILQKDDCVRLLPDNLKRAGTVLCAGKLGSDSCRGDSGGPLMMEGTYNNTYRVIQYGIVSQGNVRCGSKMPAIYTDVTKFMDWILDNIRE